MQSKPTKPTLNNNAHVTAVIKHAINQFNRYFNTNYTTDIIPPITRNDRLRAFGQITTDRYTRKAAIELNGLLSDNLDTVEARETILHEITHFFEFHHFNRTPKHSYLFICIAQTLGIKAVEEISYITPKLIAFDELANIKRIVKCNRIPEEDTLFIINSLPEHEKSIFFSLNHNKQQNTIKETYYATMKAKIERKHNVKL